MCGESIMSKLKTWYVYRTWKGNGPVVEVFDTRQGCYERLKVRCISGHAAARKYIRNNLAWEIATADFETDNRMAPDYGCLTKEMVDSRREYEKRAVIVVHKEVHLPRRQERRRRPH